MKRIASILLLGILLFNWVGYRLVSHYLEEQANAKLEAQLDNNNYDESQLIEIKVPLNLPYQPDWKEFERYDGDVEIDGIHYKYVKRKVFNGELILLCLPNKTKMNLQNASNDFFRLVNDLQHPGQGKDPNSGNGSAFKNMVTEYWQEQNNWAIIGLSFEKQQYAIGNSSYFSSGHTPAVDQPPRI